MRVVTTHEEESKLVVCYNCHSVLEFVPEDVYLFLNTVDKYYAEAINCPCCSAHLDAAGRKVKFDEIRK